MQQHVGRISIHTESTAALQFFPAVTARKKSHTKRASSPCREDVPHTVSDHDAVFNRHIHASGGQDEDVRRWFCLGNIVTGNDRDARWNFEALQKTIRLFAASRRSDRPSNTAPTEKFQQVIQFPGSNSICGLSFTNSESCFSSRRA